MRTLKRWWWVPALAVLGIVLKAALLAPWIADKVETASVGALEAEGLGDVAVEVSGVDGIGADGLNVVLEGPAADEQAAMAAVSGLDEVDNVVYRPTGSDAEADRDTGSTTTQPAEERPADAEPTEGAVELTPAAVEVALSPDGAVALRGTVADEATRAALVEAAEVEFGPGNVTDALDVDADAFTDEGGVITVTGEAESEDQRRAWVTAATAAAGAGGLEVVDEVSVRSVEATLNDLFELEPIEFDSNRATIREASIPTLDQAAATINANPDAGRLLVIGHTDSDGGQGANQRLSDTRAAAVVDYLVSTGGVGAERLESEGRGESELLIDPETSQADKQRNRRIEWELISP